MREAYKILDRNVKEEITWRILCWEDDIKVELYELWW